VIRAVLDPGVLISAVISPRGVCAELLRRWDAGEFDLVVSAKLLDEFRGVLARSKLRSRVGNADAEAMTARLRPRAFHAEDPAGVETVCRDPNDDYLIALARAGRADVLISGDKDLTSLRIVPPVMDPRSFARLLDAR